MRAGQTRHAVRNLAQRRFAEHPIRRAGGGPTIDDVIARFAGSTYGFLYDGIESSFAQVDTGAPPCVTNDSDPCAYVSDLSGIVPDRPGTQPVGVNAAVYVTRNGVKGWKSGFISGSTRWLERTATVGADWCMYLLVKPSATDYTNIVSIYDGGQIFVYYDISAGGQTYIYRGGSTSAAGNTFLLTPFIARIQNSNATCQIDVFTVAGDAVSSTAVGGGNVTGAVTFEIGAAHSVARNPAETFFCAFLDRAKVQADDDAIFAYLSAKYGSLT